MSMSEGSALTLPSNPPTGRDIKRERMRIKQLSGSSSKRMTTLFSDPSKATTNHAATTISSSSSMFHNPHRESFPKLSDPNLGVPTMPIASMGLRRTISTSLDPIVNQAPPLRPQVQAPIKSSEESSLPSHIPELGNQEVPSERRNKSPLDLLDLSHMYFDRNPRRLRASESMSMISESTKTFSSGLPKASGMPDFNASRPATTDLPVGTQQKPIKLEPLYRRSIEEARIKISDRKQSHGLHKSVNYTSQGWRTALLPLDRQPSLIESTTSGETPSLIRKDTYTITSADSAS